MCQQLFFLAQSMACAVTVFQVLLYCSFFYLHSVNINWTLVVIPKTL